MAKKKSKKKKGKKSKSKKSKKKKSKEIKRVGILSLAKVAGLFGVIYGLIGGILMSLYITLANNVAGSDPELAQQLGQMGSMGYWSIILLPILYGIIYFIIGIITAFIYNLISKNIGGIELNIE